MASLDIRRHAQRGFVAQSPGVVAGGVSLAADGGDADDILIHDETNRSLAGLLAALGGPDFPTVVGVIYGAPAAAFETAVLDQVANRPSLDSAQRDLHTLLTGGATWRVGDKA